MVIQNILKSQSSRCKPKCNVYKPDPKLRTLRKIQHKIIIYDHKIVLYNYAWVTTGIF